MKIKYSICVKEFDAGMFGVYVRCEQFGKSILIDTNVHVFHDEWDGENGIIIPSKNEEALYEAMKYAVEHPEEMKKMGEKARPLIVERYEQHIVWEALLEEYKKLLRE